MFFITKIVVFRFFQQQLQYLNSISTSIICMICNSLLHTNNITEFLKMASETYARISAYAANSNMNLSEVNLLDVLNYDDQNLTCFDIKMEAIDLDDEPIVKSEMVETVLTEDINVKLEGIEGLTSRICRKKCDTFLYKRFFVFILQVLLIMQKQHVTV